ncbi:metal-dependent hydrolase [Salarchaeum sp. JOR-1]|uniref:metal-dependent hydrolase n=1 Tax=Salarchaeum sp. JOR-1 TaxID=2599399 RepID=UPI0019808EAB|nr:metal-dependent hydrolase [Salarchaeum sp. JOR-1]
MATTHAALGVLPALVVLRFDPALAVTSAYAGYAGGVFPDLDLYLEHRKTLHHPELYPALALLATLVALAYPTPVSVAVACFLVSAALHCLTEVLGGGLGRKPWLRDDHRGVYSHLGQRWLPPRRVIPYDGSPRDLALCVIVTVPLLVVFDVRVRWLLLGGLGISVLYTVFRKRLAGWV